MTEPEQPKTRQPLNEPERTEQMKAERTRNRRMNEERQIAGMHWEQLGAEEPARDETTGSPFVERS